MKLQLHIATVGLGLLGAAFAHAAEPGCTLNAVAYPTPPYYVESAQGATGTDKDMFDELARRTGCALKLSADSRVRIWEQIRRGTPQMTLSAIPTPRRREVAEFVPYAQGHYYVLASRAAADKARTMAAFEADPSLRLLVIKGYSYGPTLDAWVQRLRGQGRIEEAGDFRAVVRMLRVRRADALLALPTAWSQVHEAFDESEAPVPLDYTPNERHVVALAMALSIPEPERQRTRQALQAMMADGTLHAILRRHVGEKAARAATYTGE
ncbi:MAG: hypothetical protein DI603_08250 [Roseateles depolymerans]|uniref:Solute-binding protein family 3/N-terminal domain-containing protein n=1 Tax=Roseateles depolymerans TaxID=76731 RepID=A0A2W5DRD7_9BURK|nr:MAG: hypothetical protein DI603_08250 [Roseateles depolymerans]